MASSPNQPPAELPSVALYFSEGNSDKEYHAAVKARDGGFVVEFAYGRRGAALKAGSKTERPVSFAEAARIYEKLVLEKTAKGYTPESSGAAFQATANAGRVTGITPQLLNAATEREVALLIDNPEWVAQQKYDGERRMMLRRGPDVVGINRKGLEVPLPQAVAEAAARLPHSNFVLDGEIIGERVYVFDLLPEGGTSTQGFAARHAELERLMKETAADGALVFAPLARSAQDKRALLDSLREREQEGIVFKRANAPYRPGRPNSGGDSLKFKFHESCTVAVTAANSGTRSVAVHAFDDGGAQVALGNVTIPPNHAVPAAGAIVEVRYLYAFAQGSLFQPQYLGERNDQDLAACTTAQLRYKAQHADVAAAPDAAKPAGGRKAAPR